MFNVGDKVVHPMHGAGVIDSIVSERINGKTQEYYVFHMPVNGLVLKIPVCNSQLVGLRSVVDAAAADTVMLALPGLEIDITTNWNRRYRENLERLKSGDLYEVGRVIKCLTLRDVESAYTSGPYVLDVDAAPPEADAEPYEIVGIYGLTNPSAEPFTDSRDIYIPASAIPYSFTHAELEENITDRTKILVLPFPNNPTGSAIKKAQLQEWVDYANKVGAVIIYDAAYEAYISEEEVPHSIYECQGARACAIELHSFSKNAGFTGVRLGFTVIPKELKCGDVSLHSLWARRHGTKYNGAPYIVQRAGEAVYSPEGKAQLKQQVAYYMNNAKYILEGLKEAGYTVSGGVNAPYIWLKAPGGMTSWEFFDFLLEKANVVGTPGSGFGPSGETYFRLTAFGSYENTLEAVNRIKGL